MARPIRFVGRYSSPDVDASAHDILQASEDCARNASECNSFYLDLYMDDSFSIAAMSRLKFLVLLWVCADK